jgi:TnsA endonuclease N terminal
VDYKRKLLPSRTSGVVATLITQADGGPMRRITNGRRHRAVGSYYSMKNRKAVPWESRVELHGFHHAEVDPNVVSYRAQPHTLELLSGGRKCLYTPDREDRHANGRIEVVEIKDKHKPERDPEYARKLALARQVYGSLGWSFRIVERADLQAEPRYSAVETLQCYRRTAIWPQDIEVLAALAKRGAPITLGDLCEALGPPAVGMRKVCAMMVRRYVAIELDRGLIDEAIVQLLQEVARDD